MNPFLSLRDYELFIYTLPEQYKHVPPNIKRNRIPAPGLSFAAPNLPFLIEELVTSLGNK